MFKIDVYNVTLDYKAQGATIDYNRHQNKHGTEPLTSHLCRPNTYILCTGISSGTNQVLPPSFHEPALAIPETGRVLQEWVNTHRKCP